MGAQKTQSSSSGMNGQSLNSSVLKKPWGCSRAERSPDMRYEHSPCLNERHGMGELWAPRTGRWGWCLLGAWVQIPFPAFFWDLEVL